jgi:hypothetical protein
MLVFHSFVPSPLLPMPCLTRLERMGRLGGRTADNRDHLFLRLRHPGGAQTARFKRDVDLQCLRMVVCSTCHDGLLAPVRREGPWTTWC